MFQNLDLQGQSKFRGRAQNYMNLFITKKTDFNKVKEQYVLLFIFPHINS
jgi:hypothetical protein